MSWEDSQAPRRIPAAARLARVRSLLADGRWHSTAEIESPDVGGSQGTRRLRELRQLLQNSRVPKGRIEARRKSGSDQWEYRYIPPDVQRELF